MQGWCAVVRHLISDAAHLETIRLAAFPEHRQRLEHLFQKHLPAQLSVKDPWGDFHAFCAEYKRLPDALSAALNAYHSAHKAYSHAKKHIARSCHLRHKGVTAADRQAWLNKRCIIIEVQKASIPYPPVQHWIVETNEIAELWHLHCIEGRLHDK